MQFFLSLAAIFLLISGVLQIASNSIATDCLSVNPSYKEKYPHDQNYLTTNLVFAIIMVISSFILGYYSIMYSSSQRINNYNNMKNSFKSAVNTL